MGRLPTALWLTIFAAGVSAAGCKTSDDPEPRCAGPISDFPFACGGDGPGGLEPSRNPDAGASLPPPAMGGDNDAPPEVPGGGGTGGEFGGSDAGAGPSVQLDAGASAPDASAPDASAPDAGEEDAGEGGVPADDAGCVAASPAHQVDGCSGRLCNTTLAQLGADTTRGACNEPAALSLACTGDISRAAAECAEESTRSLWFDNSVRSCLRSDPRMSEVARGCLDCYADELLCTLSNCLLVCVSDLDQECSSCRRQHCGPTFAACSGISAP